ncbi:type III-A CRISPR-associated RAMP protein Csm3 [Geitlerinema sp. P-1104]|uniref:type III-A CRISPR-associated RAMP protein Csm3 n=1 Tax=Geitlerinema sp. P-1104 TaxID=2546230 RepID=UPI00147786E6|nr:type III-A CRISPR-associated RAMP protein Csm3 [Geitlerinema sp. P-1104]NMG57324.1 type III-A CRISPR-associated RAMP protein Csm3 [Geitlerinema sp. P-1104]
MTYAMEQKPLLGKFRLTSTLQVETGLHIGGGGDNLDIGGLDKPVIRNPLNNYPYLPGSSIKGKMRAILERLLNKPLNRAGGSGTYRYESDDIEDGYTKVGKGPSSQFIPFQGAKHCPVSRLFGSTGANCWIDAEIAEEQGFNVNEQTRYETINNRRFAPIKGRNSPARLIVRDAHLTSDSIEQLRKIDTGLYMTEWKFENGIDRITSAANPRQIERVPAGSMFNFEIIYTVENPQQMEEDLQNIAIALAILEDDALGGHGSRGYGQISFHNFNFYYRSMAQYREIAKGNASFEAIQQAENTPQLLETFGRLNEELRKLLPDSGDS